jgi:hypothetical protein
MFILQEDGVFQIPNKDHDWSLQEVYRLLDILLKSELVIQDDAERTVSVAFLMRTADLLFKSGYKIDAIKTVRRALNCGLKHAKDYLEDRHD